MTKVKPKPRKKPKALPETKPEAEVPFETGMDEVMKAVSESFAVNLKRSYDEYQSKDLDFSRLTQLLALNQITNAQTASHQITQNSIDFAIRAKNNAASVDLLALKQHLSLNLKASDSLWNVDEQGYQVADILNDSKFQDALGVALVETVTRLSPAKK